MVIKRPYEEIPLSEECTIRTFKNGVEDEELKWHFDEEDRVVESTEKTDWLFQFDDELPFRIESKIFIPKGKWHRIIKGTNDLIVKISKIKDYKSDI